VDVSDDSTLMQAVANGNEEAFTVLFRRYHRAIFRFACRLAASPEAAEDLTQECFVRVLSSAAKFNSMRGSLRVYLYAIARNLAIRDLRNERNRPRVEEDDAAAELPDGAAGAEEALLVMEVSEVVEKAVRVLPVPQREALILVEYEGLTLEEAAQVLGIVAGAVKSRLHRARANLKKLLAPYFGRERTSDGSLTG
jgi:RNA polymerase sigma-70 factor (ECF subfamily)